MRQLPANPAPNTSGECHQAGAVQEEEGMMQKLGSREAAAHLEDPPHPNQHPPPPYGPPFLAQSSGGSSFKD